MSTHLGCVLFPRVHTYVSYKETYEEVSRSVICGAWERRWPGYPWSGSEGHCGARAAVRGRGGRVAPRTGPKT